ncbi:hypothetical protein EYB26_006348 [Talaromyces marneffei]|uniref:Uncharacterized protein n=2 Tax=Talaromyces marneffei PM1 TaxID=1077442 RepID=A0A093UX03_TALMA|nr:uncharacterized protein EYB26_006348 [Talaromyces marneffei]QGA18663.1 hypothetical protein EYB26_006348 [Talaromyces marneffei]
MDNVLILVKCCYSCILGALALLLLLIIAIQNGQLSEFRKKGSYQFGFRTDFVPVKTTIALEEASFTGGLLYDENGTLYQEVDSGQPQYVGLPGPHIDKAWKDLMNGLDVVIEGKEAEDAGLLGLTIAEPDGKSFRLSLDVYHSLHCVNLVRQALDVNYYHRNGEGPHIYRLHTGIIIALCRFCTTQKVAIQVIV